MAPAVALRHTSTVATAVPGPEPTDGIVRAATLTLSASVPGSCEGSMFTFCPTETVTSVAGRPGGLRLAPTSDAVPTRNPIEIASEIKTNRATGETRSAKGLRDEVPAFSGWRCDGGVQGRGSTAP